MQVVCRVAHRNGGVSSGGSHGPSKHRVKPVKTDHSHEVAGAHKVLVDLNRGGVCAGSDERLDRAVLCEEVDVLGGDLLVGLDGVPADVGLEEELCGGQKVLHGGGLVVVECKDTDTLLREVVDDGGVVGLDQPPVDGVLLAEVVDRLRVHTLGGRKQVEVSIVENTTVRGLHLKHHPALVLIPLGSCLVLPAVAVRPLQGRAVRQHVTLGLGEEVEVRVLIVTKGLGWGAVL